jgi:hypothetical protein
LADIASSDYAAAPDVRLKTLARKLGTTELFFERYTYFDNSNLLTLLKRSLGTPSQTLTYLMTRRSAC